MLRIKDSKVIIFTTIVVYSIIIRNAIRNNDKEVVRNNLKIVILAIKNIRVKTLKFSKILLKTLLVRERERSYR